MLKSLDRKLAAIHADPHGARQFIIADAKDADMAFGVRAPGPRSYLSAQGARPAQFSPEVWTRDEFGNRNLPEFLDIIREIVRQGLVDIMLMSASTSEVLTLHRRLFDNSPVTPACRANDTTDIHIVRGSKYPTQPSLPFRTATLDHIQCGHLDCKPEERHLGANLGAHPDDCGDNQSK